MARPRKIEIEKLTKSLPAVRCTNAELSAIKSKAEKLGMSVSEFVRRQSLNGKIVVRSSKQTIGFEVIHELRKLGININQIAKNMNIFGHPDSGDINRIKSKIDSILDNVIEQM